MVAKKTKTMTLWEAVNLGLRRNPKVVYTFVFALTMVPSFIVQTLFVQLEVMELELTADPLRFTDTLSAPSFTLISDCEKSIWKYEEVVSLCKEK